MFIFELEELIKSLSATEKKYFRLYCHKLKNAKDYLLLFDLAIARGKADRETWEEQFRKKYPSKSFENTANYLYKVLTDVLVQIRIEQDVWYKQHHSLMKAQLCFERSMPNRANRELQKAYKLASETQNHAVAYQAARMELTTLTDIGFPDICEQQLVDKQMKAKHTLQLLRQLQEHYTLYELLSHRLTKGVLTKGKQDKKVNDLILSELSLSTRGSQYQFEPQKLHLLFQSFFFIHTGEYHSALKIFTELNKFIESNESMWDYPPYDYLSALDGILDSLRSMGYYEEMTHFIEKTSNLAARAYPEHFKNLATLTAQVYQLNMYIGMDNIPQALTLLDASKNERQRITETNSHEKQLEYLYFEGLAYFLSKKWARANKCLQQFFTMSKQSARMPVYRAGRMLYILLSYEQDDIDYLEYEIRSYKRAFSKLGKAFKIEKLVFNTIALDPARRGNNWKTTTCKKINARIHEIRADKQELKLLKFYDCCEWVKNKYVSK